MSGGGQNTISTQSVPDWLAPYLQGSLSQGQQLQTSGGPAMEQLVAPLNSTQSAGVNSIASAAGAPSAGTAANNYLQTLESGAYLNPSTNPYLTGEYQQGLQGIQNTTDSQFGAAGRNILASAPVQADQASVLANQIFGPQYGTTLSAMGQGALAAPSVTAAQYVPGQELLSTGSGLQTQAQNQLTAQQNMYNYNQSLPYNTLSWYSSLVGQNANPFSTTNSSTTGTTNAAATDAGLGIGAAGLLGSLYSSGALDGLFSAAAAG